MPVPWTFFIVDNLRTCWHDKSNLKPSCTTESYAGGSPTALTELKPSIVDYATGNLKQGLTTADDTELKESMKPAK